MNPVEINTRREALTVEQIKARTMSEILSFLCDDVLNIVNGATDVHQVQQVKRIS